MKVGNFAKTLRNGTNTHIYDGKVSDPITTGMLVDALRTMFDPNMHVQPGECLDACTAWILCFLEPSYAGQCKLGLLLAWHEFLVSSGLCSHSTSDVVSISQPTRRTTARPPRRHCIPCYIYLATNTTAESASAQSPVDLHSVSSPFRFRIGTPGRQPARPNAGRGWRAGVTTFSFKNIAPNAPCVGTVRQLEHSLQSNARGKQQHQTK